VHTDTAEKTVNVFGALGVKGAAIVAGVPFVTNESAKIVEVNDGVLILREPDTHKGMVVFSATISQQRRKYYAHKNDRDRDVEWDFGQNNFELRNPDKMGRFI
jgi:hypothetical protein